MTRTAGIATAHRRMGLLVGAHFTVTFSELLDLLLLEQDLLAVRRFVLHATGWRYIHVKPPSYAFADQAWMSSRNPRTASAVSTTLAEA